LPNGNEGLDLDDESRDPTIYRISRLAKISPVDAVQLYLESRPHRKY